jgi:hypothetical protein
MTTTKCLLYLLRNNQVIDDRRRVRAIRYEDAKARDACIGFVVAVIGGGGGGGDLCISVCVYVYVYVCLYKTGTKQVIACIRGAGSV